MDKDIAIKVDNVSKEFLLPHEKPGSLKNVFLNALRGKGSKTVEKQQALKDISFEVKKGEFFGIVGRNGSGKSTLLKIVAGIYQTSKGTVAYSGRLVPFIELGVGFNPELTGRENVYLNGALMGFAKKEIDAKYSAIVEFAELERFMDQKLKNYSSGMQVRLAFSVATILAESDILLIDEVLAVGDVDFQRKCFRYFKQLKKLKKTVIFVTHDMNAVREYCDRAILIEKSEMIAEGSPEDVSKRYEKLMQPADNSGSKNASSTRWGDKTLEILELEVEKGKNEKTVTLRTKIKANKECQDPMAGFLVKNEAGVTLMGTNTQLESKPIHSLEKGEEVTIVWTFENVLADGSYIISLSAQYDNGTTNGDWWDDAYQLRVTRAMHTPFPIFPGVTTTVK